MNVRSWHLARDTLWDPTRHVEPVIPMKPNSKSYVAAHFLRGKRIFAREPFEPQRIACLDHDDRSIMLQDDCLFHNTVSNIVSNLIATTADVVS